MKRSFFGSSLAWEDSCLKPRNTSSGGKEEEEEEEEEDAEDAEDAEAFEEEGEDRLRWNPNPGFQLVI